MSRQTSAVALGTLAPSTLLTPDAAQRLTSALAERYRIERELGRGGMATVYLAGDLRHDRQVAIKVLHPELAAVLGAERFLAEIKLTAKLQHPHILPLFDSGAADGLLFYVMPFVEGETLRHRLQRERQLSVRDAASIATEVADALAYAHGRGVVHRDIKPENILLRDGHALVADFGIALAVQQAGSDRLTQTGLSLGTPAYMSPEQAAGERGVDARSDLYALGAVLFEMLAGEPPFTGATAQAIIARVMTEDPRPLGVVRRAVPPHIAAATLTALEKLPADRFASAQEFAAALQEPTLVRSVPRASADQRALRSLPWLLGVVAAAVLGHLTGSRRANVVSWPVQRFHITLPPHAAYTSDILSVLTLSPDGRLLAYNGIDSSGQRQIFLRAMDQLEPQPVPGSVNATAPFFSPDGRWLGYRTGTRLMRMPTSGGSPEPICESTGLLLMPAAWLERNTVVVADDAGLRECTMAGKDSTLLRSAPGVRFRSPHALPGDRAVLLTIDSAGSSRLAAFDLGTHRLHELGVAGSDPRYVDSEHLVYVSADQRIQAVVFDSQTLRVKGDPVLVSDSIDVTLGMANMALSRNGILVHVGPAPPTVLELVGLDGRSERLPLRPGTFAFPSISPDGRRIAMVREADIWVFERGAGVLTRLTSEGGADRPIWSPDGRQVAFVNQRGTRVVLRRVAADGSTPAESLLTLPDKELWEGRYVPRSQDLLVRYIGRGSSRRDVGLVTAQTPGELRPLLQSPADEVTPVASPDGRWLGYVSNESGRAEVYVRAYPGMGKRVQVSVDGGTEPLWSPHGDVLYFRAGSALVAADLHVGTELEIVGRRTLFTDPGFASDLTHQDYDVLPDGRGFVMVRNVGTRGLVVTLHRFENLRPAP